MLTNFFQINNGLFKLANECEQSLVHLTREPPPLSRMLRHIRVATHIIPKSEYTIDAACGISSSFKSSFVWVSRLFSQIKQFFWAQVVNKSTFRALYRCHGHGHRDLSNLFGVLWSRSAYHTKNVSFPISRCRTMVK